MVAAAHRPAAHAVATLRRPRGSHLLGTARSVSLTNEFSTRGTGTSLAISDPFVVGRDIAAHGRIANLAGTHTLRLGVRNHEYSVLEKWRAEGNLARLSHGDTATTDRALHTIAVMALAGRRIDVNRRAAPLVLAGLATARGRIRRTHQLETRSPIHARLIDALGIPT